MAFLNSIYKSTKVTEVQGIVAMHAANPRVRFHRCLYLFMLHPRGFLLALHRFHACPAAPSDVNPTGAEADCGADLSAMHPTSLALHIELCLFHPFHALVINVHA